MASFMFMVDVPATPASGVGLTRPSEWVEFTRATAAASAVLGKAIRHRLNVWSVQADGLAWDALNALAKAATDNGLAYSVFMIEGEVTPIKVG
jgi:hypothetical protein